ncbi:MAG: hypothetical protein KKA64_01100 [Nanoarchaeota archaeon]|nr:hypothetical protein [Nanoarchaeota archaeon]
MKTWLKGGLIGAGFLVLCLILIVIINWLAGGVTSFASYLGIIILFIPLSVMNLFGTYNEDTYLLLVLFGVYILTPIFFFVMGSLIGWIVDKIKSSKK